MVEAHVALQSYGSSRLHVPFVIENIYVNRKFKGGNRIGGVMVRRARIEYGSSWVRAPVGSNQRL